MKAPARATRALWLLALLALAPVCARAQDTSAPAYKIAYRISMTEPASHVFRVVVDVEGLTGQGHVDFQMPRWSPGRYAVYDFARNVYGAKASGPCGREERCGSKGYPVERVDTQTWRVSAPELSKVTFSYNVVADDLSGTFSQLDERHANFNGASVFVYVVGHKHDPVTLKVGAPAGWKVFNGQSKGEGQTEFSFPNYDVLIDTPTEVGPDFNVQTFEVGGKSYRVLVHSFGDEGGRRGDLTKVVERVVRAELATMPEPDYEQYTFIFHFGAGRDDDGMEHLNSTQIVETGEMANPYVLGSAVDTAAHEFYHVWNVKRLRPEGLGPWDFTRPVVTRGLWIAEGFTNYFGKLAQRRAGLWNDEQLLELYARNIEVVENKAGNRVTSAVEASILAPFIDRPLVSLSTNVDNTVVSYYQKGETLAVVLDLLIRGRSKGRASLETVMRRAYEEFYLKAPRDSYYLKGRAYTVEEFERLASEVTGVDLSDFFRRHAHDVQPPPYDEAFGYVGLRLARTPDGARTNFRIEKDDKASAEARALREAWMKGK